MRRSIFLSAVPLGAIVIGACTAGFAQSTPRTLPLPNDPLEIVTESQPVDAHPNPSAVAQLLNVARDAYALRSADRPYDLKVTFNVNSGGETQYDGAWQMEDTFVPGQGLRWTANMSNAYSITGIFTGGKYYGDGIGDHIPLRLQEARAALFDPIPPPENVGRARIRTSSANFNGTRLTCVLISTSAKGAMTAQGRRWDETEECIDPQTGLLRLHSQAPGRYYLYDYTDAPQLAGRVLPRNVTVTEGGKTVSVISVESLTGIPAANPALFTPTDEMKARGEPIAMGGAQRIARVVGRRPLTPGATAHAICVFGVVTPSGQLVEAHSLQPADPNSPAALQDAKQIRFPGVPVPGSRPQQHFVFVIEEFAM